MPRSYSLQHKKEFDLLFKKGKRRYSRYFTAVYAQSTSLKFGLIVQKKNVSLASHRNYCRRVMREIIRTSYVPKVKAGYHIALIVKTDLKVISKEAGFEAIKKDLTNLLMQVQ